MKKPNENNSKEAPKGSPANVDEEEIARINRKWSTALFEGLWQGAVGRRSRGWVCAPPAWGLGL